MEMTSQVFSGYCHYLGSLFGFVTHPGLKSDLPKNNDINGKSNRNSGKLQTVRKHRLIIHRISFTFH